MIARSSLWIGILASVAPLAFLVGGARAEKMSEEVSLECREFGTGFYTILPQEQEGIPLLAYQEVESPEEICQETTEKLNSIISNRGNWLLSDLLLRTGTVQSQDVICAVFRISIGCSSRNVVLNVPDGEVPADFLEGLLPADIQVFSLGDPNQHTRRRTYAQFGRGIQRKLKTLPEK
ncbi:MAG: hypothetical protein EA342_17945 [Leptolyngbya sp. LCM1.Bin17]|nr:MAG: hypothetical protein EA342_17945 [Leptolyngbya sp. LCM1.Bin17]